MDTLAITDAGLGLGPLGVLLYLLLTNRVRIRITLAIGAGEEPPSDATRGLATKPRPGGGIARG